MLRSIELCAGAGGQALGLEQAGFEPLALIENDPHARATLRRNRPSWNVVEGPASDIFEFDASSYRDSVDLVAAGVPCPPFSKAGKQLGRLDERDLFPEALRIIEQSRPRAVLLENVRGLLDPKFDEYRAWLTAELKRLGYDAQWTLLQASGFGVPQLRPRTICVALSPDAMRFFTWPSARTSRTTVGTKLRRLMASRGWRRADEWALKANRIAPTLVGGSKKHGGPDLGPTRAKKEWTRLNVNAHSLAEFPPDRGFVGSPRLTVAMAARLQGFPAKWKFTGRKTNAYRQVGNAFPPPVARAVGEAIRSALEAADMSAAQGSGNRAKAS